MILHKSKPPVIHTAEGAAALITGPELRIEAVPAMIFPRKCNDFTQSTELTLELVPNALASAGDGWDACQSIDLGGLPPAQPSRERARRHQTPIFGLVLVPPA